MPRAVVKKTHHNAAFDVGHPVPPIVVGPEDRTCAICTKDVPVNGTRPTQVIVQLDCGHYFYFLYIHRWGQTRLRQQLNCPRCSVPLRKLVFPEFYGARCLSEDTRFGFRYACARAKHFHDLGLPDAVTWDGSRIVSVGHAKLYVATFVYVVLVKTGDEADILDMGSKWKMLNAMFLQIALLTKSYPMDTLLDRLWYNAHVMFTFQACVCLKEGRPSEPRCYLSGEEVGLKALAYMKEVVRRSILLALVASDPVAFSPAGADYVQPPSDPQRSQNRQDSDFNQAPSGVQASSGRQALALKLRTFLSRFRNPTREKQSEQSVGEK